MVDALERAAPIKQFSLAKGLAIGKSIDYRLKPLIDRFGDRGGGHQDGGYRRLHRRSEAASRRRPSAESDPVVGIDQSHDRATAAHDELGGRPRVPRTHAVPTRNGDTDPETTRRQQTAALRGGRSKSC